MAALSSSFCSPCPVGEADSSCPIDPVEIEMLLAHEVEVARRQSAAGRPGVAPRRKRLALGIGKAFDVAVALTLPVGLQIIPPAIAEIGTQILERALGMDIAVEDADPRPGPTCGCLTSMFMAAAPSKLCRRKPARAEISGT